MKVKVLTFLMVSMLAVALIAAGCSSTQGATSSPPPVTTTTPPPLTTTTVPPTTTTTPPATTTTAAVITILGNAYDPATLTVRVGTEVTWTNPQHEDYSITSDIPGLFGGGIPGGSTYDYTFTQPGTYTYHDSTDPGIKGTIIVTP